MYTYVRARGGVAEAVREEMRAARAPPLLTDLLSQRCVCV